MNYIREHNLRLDRSVKLWNKLVRYHNHLIKTGKREMIERFWKNFIPLLPAKWRKSLTKIDLKNSLLRERIIVKDRIF